MADVQPAVKALIERDGEFLALKTDADGGEPRWGLPGGRVEHGESPHEALRREVREEVGLEIDIHEPVGTFHFFWEDTEIVPTVFRCTRTGGEPDVGDGVDGDQILMEARWMEPGDFLDRRAEAELKRVVRDRYHGLPKLVRDRIPAIVRDDGDDPVTETVDDAEAERWVREKLVEEAREFRDSGDVAELADLLDVVDRALELDGTDREALASLREGKREERGGFTDNVVLRRMD